MNQGSIQDAGESGLAVEGQLPSLTDRLKSLYVAIGQDTRFLGTEAGFQEFRAEVQRMLRRSVTGQILQDKAYVAVAGLQGAGKSTFVRYLLGLDDAGIVVETAGLGEYLPIFITFVDSPSEQRRYVRAFGEGVNEGFIAEREILGDQWHDVLVGSDPNVLSVHVELSLDSIPQDLAQVMGVRKGIALLPGYAESDPKSDEDYSQELMREALTQSSAVIVVASKSDLANVASREVIDDLRKYLPGIVPAVVVPRISRAEANHPENVDLHARVEEIFDLGTSGGESQPVDRVIFYDANDDEPADREALGFAVASVLAASSHSSARIDVVSQNRVRANSTGQLIDDVLNFLREIDDMSMGSVVPIDVSSTKARVVLEAVLGETLELRNIYDRELTKALQSRTDKATSAALARHTEINEWDLKDWRTIKVGWRKIFETVAESESKYEELVNQSWEQAIVGEGTGEDSFAIELAKIVGNVVQKRLKANSDFVYNSLWSEDGDALNKPEQIPEVDRRTRNNELAYLLGVNKRDEGYTPDTLDAARFLPAYLLIWDQLDPGNALTESSGSADSVLEFGGDAGKFIERLQNLNQQQRLMIQTVGAIFFVEAGELTLEALITNVATGLMGGAALPAAAVAAATVVAAAVGIATLVLAVQAHMKRVDARNRNQLRGAMKSISGELKEALMEHFDDIMDATYRQVESTLRKDLNLEAPVIAELNLEKAISDTRAIALSMRAGSSKREIFGH